VELPFRVELAKLSGVDVLELFLPFIPGVVVTVSLTVVHAPIVARIATIFEGWTRLVIAIILAYVIGMAMMMVVQSCGELVMGQIKKPSKAGVWKGPYWRKVAAAYVGSGMLPDSSSLQSADLDRALKFSTDLVDIRDPAWPDAMASLTKIRSQLHQFEENVRKLEDAAAKGEQSNAEKAKEVLAGASAAIAAMAAQRKLINDAENLARSRLTDSDWFSLYKALLYLSGSVPHPFGLAPIFDTTS